MALRWSFLFLITLLPVSNLFAQVILQNGEPATDFGKLVYYTYLEKTSWTPGDKENLNFKFPKGELNLAIPVQNNSDFEHFYLVIENPFIDTLTVRQASQGKAIVYRTGTFWDVSTRPIAYGGYALPFHLPKGAQDSIYLQINSKSSSILPMSIQNPTSFANYLVKNHLFFGLLYGAVLIMLLYNLFIYFSLRKESYLWYCLFVVCNLGIYLSIEGHLKLYVFTGQDQLALRATTFFIALINPVAVKFAVAFLGRLKLTKTSRILLYILGSIGLAIAVLTWILPVSWFLKPAQLLSLTTVITLFTLGFKHQKDGNKSAIYFLAAFAVYLLGTSAIIFRNLDLFPVNWWTSHLIELGSMLEISLLSLALADQFRRFEKDKTQAQHALFVHQKEANATLEQKVHDRTLLLQTANDEISAQNEELKLLTEEISTQRDNLDERNKLIEQKNTDIQSSINYAKRIQTSILPKPSVLKHLLGSYTLLYKPKQTVSGDIYYVNQVGTKVIVSVIDCTGHGVPGAIMSMIAYSAIEQVVAVRELTDVSQILSEMHQIVQNTLKQKDGRNQDGMDMSILSFDHSTRTLKMAAARNDVWYSVNQNPLEVFKADRLPVGGLRREEDYQYNHRTIQLRTEESVRVFLYSDGYQDQFGGPRDKKFGRQRLKDLVEHSPTSKDLTLLLDLTLEKWMKQAREAQIDDICLLGCTFQ